jgi:hypothetical protein
MKNFKIKNFEKKNLWKISSSANWVGVALSALTSGLIFVSPAAFAIIVSPFR